MSKEILFLIFRYIVSVVFKRFSLARFSFWWDQRCIEKLHGDDLKI